MDEDEAAIFLNKLIADNVTARIVPLIAGLELSITHVINTLHHSGVLDREAVARSFEATSEGVPEATKNREAIAQVPMQIAQMIRHAAELEAAGKPADIRAMLRLVPGGLSEKQQPDNPASPPE